MRFKTTKKHRSATTMKEYPQVRKTGVNAVHEESILAGAENYYIMLCVNSEHAKNE